MTKPPIFEGVQALRFAAALLVVITHSTFYAHERLDESFFVWKGGSAGVDIFFIISGFVMMITAEPFQTTGGWKYFAMRRLVRIVPMYWIATTLKVATMIALPATVLHAALTPWSTFASYLFLPTRNPGGSVEPLLGVGWTLTFEMAFYAVFALGLLLRQNVLIFASTIMIIVASGHAIRGDGDWPTWAVYFDQIVLYFVVGMAIGKIALLPNARRYLLLALAVAVAVVAVSALTPEGISWSRNALSRKGIIAGIFIAVILAEPFVQRLKKRPALNRLVWLPTRYMGDASYSLYLFHSMIAPAVPVALGIIGVASPYLSVFGSVSVSIAAAAIIYAFVERPMTRKLRRLPYAGHLPSLAVRSKTMA